MAVEICNFKTARRGVLNVQEVEVDLGEVKFGKIKRLAWGIAFGQISAVFGCSQPMVGQALQVAWQPGWWLVRVFCVEL